MKFSRSSVRVSVLAVLVAALFVTLPARSEGVVSIDRVVITVADIVRTETFYREGLGFTRVTEQRRDDPALAHLLGVEHAKYEALLMRLGGQEVEFDQYDEPGHAYPADSRSPDLWFQHIAIVVSDMPGAYRHLLGHVPSTAISIDGPQTLPESSGRVQAYKFRDPDGHPLELLYFPPGQGRPIWTSPVNSPLFLGIDHSAIAISSTPASLGFYARRLGMKPAYNSINRGATQEHLDGTFNAVVEINGLRPGTAEAQRTGMGIEFLDYRTPPNGRPATVIAANDIAHVHLVLRVTELQALGDALFDKRIPFVSPGVVDVDRALYGYAKALMLTDPDGHALLLTE